MTGAPEEAEDIFFHQPLVVRSDVRHSKTEKRYYALGQTGAGRRLFLVFSIRRRLIRVILVRDMNSMTKGTSGQLRIRRSTWIGHRESRENSFNSNHL